MRRIKLYTRLSRDEILSVIADSEFVNDRVRFDEGRGKPVLHVKDKGHTVKMRCEMIGGPTKDNGFLEGTYLVGRLTQTESGTELKGIIVTAPIYHTLLAALFAFYVYKCFELGGVNPIPIIMLFFSIFMFKREFEKQGVIYRYLHRAFKRADKER